MLKIILIYFAVFILAFKIPLEILFDKLSSDGKFNRFLIIYVLSHIISVTISIIFCNIFL